MEDDATGRTRPTAAYRHGVTITGVYHALRVVIPDRPPKLPQSTIKNRPIQPGNCLICREETPLWKDRSPTHPRRFLVRDHCHVHGWFRGYICNQCNDKIKPYEAELYDPMVKLIKNRMKPSVPDELDPACALHWHRCQDCARAGWHHPWIDYNIVDGRIRARTVRRVVEGSYYPVSDGTLSKPNHGSLHTKRPGFKQRVTPSMPVDDDPEVDDFETHRPDDFDGGFGPNSYFSHAMLKDD